ncbi:MAG: hypothetical protein AAF718_10885 [Pseudomonadota bacterium]
MNRWFEVDNTRYFKSKARCTVAIFGLDSATPRDSFPVQKNPQIAKAQFRESSKAAIQMEELSPHDIADALLLDGDGIFGKQVLAAAALAGPCFSETEAEPALYRVMMRPGAILAYDRDTEGMILLDPIAMSVFYVAGDVW